MNKAHRQYKKYLTNSIRLFFLIIIVSLAHFNQISANKESTITIVQTNQTNSSENDFNFELFENSEHKLKISEYSHYNLPVYVNYTVVNIEVEFESDDVDAAKLELHYSHNGINWTSRAMIYDHEVSNNCSAFQVNFGPFLYASDYLVKINASKDSSLLATVITRIIVDNVTGIVFTDFAYNLTALNNGTQFINVQIGVLGSDLDNNTIMSVFNQPEDKETKVKMQLISGSTNKYNVSIGPVDEWGESVEIIFEANTTEGANFISASFLIEKSPPIYPEDFWRQKFPAIIVGVFVVIAMGIIFIIARRKPPKTADFEKEIKKSSRKKGKQKKEKQKKKEEDDFSEFD